VPNNLNREQFRQDVRDANYAGRRTVPSLLVWIVVIVLAGLAISAAVWGIRVATAPAKGAGDTILKDQDANNRIAQQKAFVNMYEGVKANDKKLQTLANTAAKNPADTKAQADFDGTQMICLDQVADYNAKVQETLATRWLPADLPASIGDDPLTDCAPNNPPSAVPAR
jgi:hypothetical protein